MKTVQSIETDVAIFGFGSITKNIISNLQNTNTSVICISNNEYSQIEVNDCKDVKFLTRAEIVKTELQTKKTLFSWRNVDPLLQNSGEVQEWLKSSQFTSDQSFLLSSASVYANSNVAINESEINLDLNAPSDGKLSLEATLLGLMKDKSIFHSNLRISNAYGPSLEYGFIAALRRAIGSQTSVQVFEGREIIRDYIFISDIVFAVNQILMAEFPYSNINISTGKGNSIVEVLQIFGALGHFFKNQINVVPKSEIVSSSILDCTLLASLIEWKPRDLNQGIHELLNL
jgi:UDP-glucose 4-epimerase